MFAKSNKLGPTFNVTERMILATLMNYRVGLASNYKI